MARLRFVLVEQRRFRLDQLNELDRSGVLHSTDPVALEVAESLAAGARAALVDVCEALRQIEAGRYGWCRDCGARLPIERLVVLPHITRCASCLQATSRI